MPEAFSHREMSLSPIIQKCILCGVVAGTALVAAESLVGREGIQHGASAGATFVIFLLDIVLGALIGAASGLLLTALNSRTAKRRVNVVVSAFCTSFFMAGLLYLFSISRLLLHPLPISLLKRLGLPETASLVYAVLLLGAMSVGCLFYFSLTRMGKKIGPPTYIAEIAIWSVLLVCIPHFVSWPSISIKPLVSLIGGAFLVYFTILRIVSRLESNSAVRFENTVSPKVVGIFLTTCAIIIVSSFGLYKPERNTQNGEIAMITGTGGTQEKFSVILVVLDTLRADHMSIYGYERETTPNIDRFAADCVIFDTAYSTSSWTLPAHASLFTGLFPSVHGARDMPGCPEPNPRLSADHITLAEILERQGYATTCISANFFYVIGDFGLDQGFEYFDSRPRFLGVGMPMSTALLSRCFSRVGSKWFAYLTEWLRTAEEITDSALRWVANEEDGPFFLFLNYMDPHSPYLPPSQYDVLFPGTTDHTLLDRIEEPILTGERGITEAEHTSLVSSYDGEIAYLDSHLGRLIAALRERGLYEKTMIIVTSDHGEYFGEHGLLEHHKRLYQEVLRIPLLIKYPHSMQVGRRRHPVQILDVMPTILNTLDMPIPASVQGDVLSSINHEIVAEQWASPRHVRLFGKRFDRNLRAIFCNGMKYIRSSDGQDELYNLVDDPSETSNLITEQEGLRKEMVRRLTSWEASMAELAEAGRSITVDEELAERMKALGYLED